MVEFQDGVFMVAALGSAEPQPEMRLGRFRIKIRGFGQGLGGLVEAFKVVVGDAEIVEHVIRVRAKSVDAREQISGALVLGILRQH